MTICKEFDIEVDENEIIRLIGYSDSSISEEILNEVRNAIKNSKKIMEPKVVYGKFNIIKFDKKKKYIYLDSDIVLEGEYVFKNLKACDQIIMNIATAGEKFDEIIQNAFNTGDFLKGLVYDNIGNYIVSYIDKLMWTKYVKDVQQSNLGITNRMSPGDFDWDIMEQKKLFKSIDPSVIGIKLSESCLMIPMKSISTIYGIGKEIGIGRVGHTCKDCKLKNCVMRVDQKIKLMIKNKGIKKSIEVKRGTNLLKILRENNIFIEALCNGKGTCGKCKVRCVKMIPNPSGYDKKHLTKEEIEEGYRLACGITVSHPMEIEILDGTDNIKVLADGIDSNYELNSRVTKKYLQLKEATIEDQRDDCKRVLDELEKQYEISYNVIKKLPQIIRQSNYHCTITIFNDKIIDIEGQDTVDRNYCLAVDIGTTTVVTYLINLNSGKVIDIISGMNEQRVYGADVASRIQFTMENEEGLMILKNAVINQLNKMIDKLCSRNNINNTNIYDTVLVGNTTMIHILLEISPKNIGRSPYIPVFTDSITLTSKQMGLNTNGYSTVLKGISSYVGSDITAGILACGMYNSEKYSLLLDLGTNGEMALGNKDKIITCSTAAGPAFEGASIKYGIGGIKGAISKVNLSKDKIYETIGNGQPYGICGSGVLDAVAQLYINGLIDETGRFLDAEELKDHPLKDLIISDEKGISQLILYNDSKNAVNNIYFTQKDIREVQLAKAAIYAGIKILINESGIEDTSAIENVYIAGGFGNYMNVDSALKIGLIPNELKDKVTSIGNSAGTGSKMCVLSSEYIEDIKTFVSKAKYIELSSRLDFQEYFVDGMTIGG